MNFLANFLSDTVASALGWTLLHSLWQGTLVVLVLCVALQKMKSAKWRYIAAYISLLSLFTCSCGTFYMHYASETTIGLEQTTFLSTSFDQAEAYFEVEKSETSIWNQVSYGAGDFIEHYKKTLICAWLLGFGLFFLQLLGGIWQVQRMRNQGLMPVPVAWQGRFSLLLSKTKCRKNVGFFYSSKTSSPLTLGHFKPLILFPIGLLNQLSVEQVEAALAHELAHIIRQDFGLNLFQSILEALYYYHPAVWYVGRVIRTEREHCCDDFAMQLCQNPLIYAKTLVEIETIQAKFRRQPALAMALNGKNKPVLLNRIKRILNQSQQKNTQIMEKFVATTMLFICFTFWTLQAKTDLFEQPTEDASSFIEKWIRTVQGDTIKPIGTGEIRIEKRINKFRKDDGENDIEITMEDDEVSELIVNGTVVPAEKYGDYADAIDEMKQMKEGNASGEKQSRIVTMEVEDEEFMEEPESPTAPTAPAAPRKIRKEVRVETRSDGKSRVTTKTDDDGNTMIFIEGDENKTEIKVVDGKVFMNGKEVKDGEIAELPGQKNTIFIDQNGKETIIRSGNDGEDKMSREERRAERDSRMEEQQAEMRERMEQAKEQAKDAVRQIEIRIEEMESKMDENRQERSQNRNNRNNDAGLSSGEKIHAMRGLLEGENAIMEGKTFEMTLTTKKLTVNGKKQSKELRDKMIDLYQDIENHPLSDGDTIQFRDERD